MPLREDLPEVLVEGADDEGVTDDPDSAAQLQNTLQAFHDDGLKEMEEMGFIFSEYAPREDLLLAKIYPLDDPACCKIFAPQSNDAPVQAPAAAAKYEGPEIDIKDYLAGVDESSLS